MNKISLLETIFYSLRKQSRTRFRYAITAPGTRQYPPRSWNCSSLLWCSCWRVIIICHEPILRQVLRSTQSTRPSTHATTYHDINFASLNGSNRRSSIRIQVLASRICVNPSSNLISSKGNTWLRIWIQCPYEAFHHFPLEVDSYLRYIFPVLLINSS